MDQNDAINLVLIFSIVDVILSFPLALLGKKDLSVTGLASYASSFLEA